MHDGAVRVPPAGCGEVVGARPRRRATRWPAGRWMSCPGRLPEQPFVESVDGGPRPSGPSRDRKAGV